MNLKNSIAFILLFSMISCDQKKKESIPINQEKAKAFFHNQPKVMLYNCTACSCFMPEMQVAYQSDSVFFKQLYVAKDSNCNPLSFKTVYISQNAVDEISDDLYNIILFKLENGQYKTRIIETKESKKIIKVAKDFFDE